MFHYTYKITSNSGLYYIGRHSTKNIDDGYMGSGKWVTDIKDKSKLSKEILEYFDNFNELQKAEESLLYEHINKKGCMNFNNKSVGFATGDLNPMHRPEIKEILRIKNIGNNNPMFGVNRSGANNGMYGKKFPEETIQILKAINSGTNNNMYGKHHNEKSKNLMSIAIKNRKPIFCIYCKKEICPPTYARCHGKKCKYYEKNI